MGEAFMVRRGGFMARIHVVVNEGASLLLKYNGNEISEATVPSGGGSTTFIVHRKGTYFVTATSSDDSIEKTYGVIVEKALETRDVYFNFNMELFGQNGIATATYNTSVSSTAGAIVDMSSEDIVSMENITFNSGKMVFIRSKNKINVSKWSKIVLRIKNIRGEGGEYEIGVGTGGAVVYPNTCLFGLSNEEYWRGLDEYGAWAKVGQWTTLQNPANGDGGSNGSVLEKTLELVDGSNDRSTKEYYVGFGVAMRHTWSNEFGSGEPKMWLDLVSLELVR